VNFYAKSYTNADMHESKSSSFGGLVGSHSVDAISQTKLANSATTAKNSITVGGKNINIIANDLEAKNGTVKLQAKNNINITSGQELSTQRYIRESKGLSLGLDGGKFTYAEITKDSNANTNITNKASHLQAKNVLMQSQGDTNIIASNIDANSLQIDTTKDLNLLAAHDTNINTQEHSKKDIGIEFKLTSKEASVFTGYWEDTHGKTTTQKDVAKSSITADNLNIQAESANIVGSDVLANNLMIDAKNTNISSATTSRDTHTYTKSIKAGVSVGVTQHVSDAVESLKSIGDAQSATAGASRTLKAYDALNSFMQKPVDAGVYAIYQEQKTTTDEHSKQTVASNIYATHDATLHAEKTLDVGGSNIHADNNLELQANNINLHATASQYSRTTKSTSKNAKASLYGSDMGTLTLGFQDSSNKIEATTQTNTHITAGNKATLTSEEDTTLKGAVVDANELDVKVGRNLLLQSLQDTQTIRGKSKGGSLSVNVLTGTPTGASANYGTTKGDKRWTNELTSLNGKKAIKISVNDTTTLKGATITNRDKNGKDQANLELKTKYLKTEDLHDYDNYKNQSGGIGVGSLDSNPSLNSMEFAYNSKNKAQLVRATIGKGTITTSSDTTSLNRDTSKTKQITKDESTNVELYASDTSIKALTNPTQAYTDITQKANDVGLAAHKEIQENLPSATKGDGFIDKTIGALVDTAGEYTYGVIPTTQNDGGYITQIATQVFGDNRNIIKADTPKVFKKWGLKQKDKNHPNSDWDYEQYITVEGKVQYRTNPSKAVRIDEIYNADDPLSSYKIYLSSKDIKEAKINHMFTNGLNNTADEAMTNQEEQQGQPTIAMLNYNVSHGTLVDLFTETTTEKTTIMLDEVPGVQTLGFLINGSARQTGNSINKLAKINDGDIKIAAHSQGTQQTYLGLQQHKEELAKMLKENPNAVLTLQNSGSPVSSKAAKELVVNDIYGGKKKLLERPNIKSEDDVFRSQANPGDPVAMLGGNFGGVNNYAPITSKDFWQQLGYTLTRGLPTLMNGSLKNNQAHPKTTSPHAGLPCVIGCGDNGVTPNDVKFYFDVTTQKSKPLFDYYKTIRVDSSKAKFNTGIH